MKSIFRNLLLDLKYGGTLAGSKKTVHMKTGAYEVTNVQYEFLPHIFGDNIKPDDVLVDVGCGRGRVINWWLHTRPNNRIIGIELDEETATSTRKRLSRYSNVTILCGDAVDLLPPEGTVISLFNPFNGDVMTRFKNRLYEVFKGRTPPTIYYYAPVHINVFKEDPNWSVEERELPHPGHDSFRPRHVKMAIIRLKTTKGIRS